ncbi:hypothetical protein O181_066642 [Austropuccinia psidii MF-1]|uniref:AAA+ ATPase domain-containing protein n=1 Tax=Austropuccinia psidii MF-1 TaxID=1389203 RepID=A0A9Q3EVU5_9BASI|nr:hypothetical protein [Austropuccinia psidii MF-1]
MSISGLDLLNSILPKINLHIGHLSIDSVLDNSNFSKYNSHLQIQGPPGIGKTKLILGLATRSRFKSIQFNSKFYKNFEILLIDADGSLHPQLIKSSSISLLNQSNQTNSNLLNHLLNGIHLVRITNPSQLAFFFKNLSNWLIIHQNVKLIILDSITSHTRYVSMSINHRAIIAKIIKDALNLASSIYNCTIIVTSQLTSKSIPTNHSSNTVALIPPDFKSNSWSNSNLSTLSLMYDHLGNRKAIVILNQNSNKPHVFVTHFDINEIGIFEPIH